MVRTPKIKKIYYDLIIEFKMQRSLLETYLQTEISFSSQGKKGHYTFDCKKQIIYVTYEKHFQIQTNLIILLISSILIMPFKNLRIFFTNCQQIHYQYFRTTVLWKYYFLSHESHGLVVNFSMAE